MDFHITITEYGVIRYPIHKHDFCEIMLYLEGTGYLKIEKEHIPFRPQTAIIVPKNISHGSVSEKGFKNISIGGNFENLLLFDAPLAINATANSMIIGKLIYENRFSDSVYLNALINCYILSLMQTYNTSSQIDTAVDNITKDISENAFRMDFDVTSALHASGYAEDYIRAKFKARTGKTPIGFLNHIRIEHACKLINIYGTGISITDLSEKCGYLNPVYFSRVFKSIKGVSPRQYTKIHFT